MSDNQTSVGNATPVENDVLKQLVELKERFDKMTTMKEKEPVTNFHITEYVLHPTSSASFKTFKHSIFEGDNDPRSHLSEFLRVSQMNRYNEEDVLRAFSQTLHKDYQRWYDGLDEESVLAAEDAEEAERKALEAKLAEEKIEATPEEEEEVANADEVVQAIKDTCNECIE
ncbi:hypothetical protein JCGZ_22253 [Jatropha curcas]|uniref:Retrotransposon gag domain-containing protein n=1 Tax=Jatropha curcas TaxID=180498 RepID=A0A067JSL9_JATCU|nr:hypothetical protein JCGZ_22253 [Jatropha curcas]